jgi:phosphatidylglycerol:prolipoprotein diacylglycerol transferase
LGFGAAFILARFQAAKAKWDPRHVDNVFLLLLVLTPIGARLFSRAFYMPWLPAGEIWKLWKGGGLVFYGGFVFGVAGILVYSLWAKLSIIPFCDLFAPSLALGLAFGRVGCFLGGCCWGDVCLSDHDARNIGTAGLAAQIRTFPLLSPAGMPLAVRYPAKSDPYKSHLELGLMKPGAERSLPVHPVQLYEAVLALVLCAGLLRFKSLGGPTLGFLWGYGLIRFLTEFFRADNTPIYAGATLSQMISLLLALAAALVWFRLRARQTDSPRAVALETT